MELILRDRGKRFCTACLLAVCAALVPLVSRAATYWQIQQPTVTVIAEGSREDAKAAAETLLRLRSAARSLLSWPDSYQEPPVLAFVVNERLLRRTFQFPPDLPGAYADATARHGTWGRTAALTVVAAAMGYERGREFRSLQRMYGESLVDAEPSHDWPACAKQGMTLVFTGAELTPPNHFYLAGTRVIGYESFWNPEEVLTPADKRSAQWLIDERGYSCYLLNFMIASSVPEERRAFEKMLTVVGRGTPLATATLSELHKTLPEFTDQYREFSRQLRLSPRFREVREDLPEQIPPLPEPSSRSEGEVRALMGKLCEKLQNCRK